MIKRIGIVLFCTLVVSVVTGTIVLAIADPDDPSSIDDIFIYEDLLEDGDVGVLVNYYIDYTVAGVPDETVTEAYLVIFVDTSAASEVFMSEKILGDGANNIIHLGNGTNDILVLGFCQVGGAQLKAIAPYAFEEKGYFRGMAWVYFSAVEVEAYNLDDASKSSYRIWLTGNPTITSGWTGDPPKTITGISNWFTTGDPAVRLAQQVLSYASMLETAWSPLNMIEATGLGNRLTSTGEAYFTNVIANLRDMAPACFSTGTKTPASADIDYVVSFGAIATSGTAIISGSPVTLTSGSNTITATTTGTFVLELEAGTYGTITDDTGTITGSPADLVPGENTVTITGAGDFTVDVDLVSPQHTITSTVEGTGFDLTDVAARFGMSRMMFSGLIWTLVTILICGATYMSTKRLGGMDIRGAGSITMLVAVLSLIGGSLMGLLDMRIIAFVAIGYGAFIGYIIFFRTSADIGRTIMFMGWMWFVVCLIGGLLTGIVPQASTTLTASIEEDSDIITVENTTGFRSTGIIVIGDERIAHHKITDTTFEGTTLRPLIRGAQDTEATAHLVGSAVRSTENAILNDTLSYNVALLSDASGIMAFVTIPLVVWDILTSFIFLPIGFLGTDMVILTYIWAIIGLGLLISIFIALIGGRRV